MERNEHPAILAVVSVLIAILCTTAQGSTIYVDDDAAPGGDGSSWQHAYTYLQDALAAALPGDEIHVGQGIYKPDTDSAHPDGTGDRDASFRLLDGVAIKGGFAGVGAADPNARDIARYESVLSGDLAGDDVPVVDPCDLLTEPTRAENTYHIVTAEPCGRSAVLDGFTISSGKAQNGGGGLYLPQIVMPCSPSIRNCTFIGNCANGGAAVCVYAAARPELIDCLFIQNAALQGGAMESTCGRSSDIGPGDFLVRGCVFAWNFAAGAGKYAAGTGGAIDIRWAPPSAIADCTFVGNRTELGGAIYTSAGGNIVNCRFIQNMADQMGGAIYVDATEMTVASCTFFDNIAACAKACYAEGQATLSVSNTILWDGGDEMGMGEGALAYVAYSDMQGGWPGEGNIDTDPLFAAPGYWDVSGTPDDPNDDFFVVGDYHLKSQAGRWDPNSQDWVIDAVTSPCIDAGDPNSPVANEPEPNGGRINMGAYGGMAEASRSWVEESVGG
jgi:hypothetical protein